MCLCMATVDWSYVKFSEQFKVEEGYNCVKDPLTIDQMTKFILTQIERICRQQNKCNLKNRNFS